MISLLVGSSCGMLSGREARSLTLKDLRVCDRNAGQTELSGGKKQTPLFAYLQACLHSNNLLNFMDCKQTPHGIVCIVSGKAFSLLSYTRLGCVSAAWSQDSFCLARPADLSSSSMYPSKPFWTWYFPALKTVCGKFHRQFTCSMDRPFFFFLHFFFPLLVLSLPSDRCRMLLGRNGKQLSPLLQAGDSWSVYLFLTQMSFHTFHHLCCPFLCFLPSCTSLSEMGRSGLQKIFKKWIHHGFPQ